MSYDRRSSEAQVWRRLYKTVAWQRIRLAQLAAEPLCRMCQADGRVTLATVCDHIDLKLKEDPATFFEGPFQSLCKPHHDSTKQREEKRGYIIGCDEAGRPLDPAHPWNAKSALDRVEEADPLRR